MERLLQYLDDIDDLLGALGLAYERCRRLFLSIVSLAVGGAIVVSGILLALVHPPIALATGILLFVALLYRKVTSPSSATSPPGDWLQSI